MQYVPQTQDEYIQAQQKLVSEALTENLALIPVYPAQNRELWLLDKSYKTIGLIHRWLFFSEYIKSGKPEEKYFGIPVFANLLKRAVKAHRVPHPGRAFTEFAEEALEEMERRGIVQLLIQPNGFIGACIRHSGKRTPEIEEGIELYQKYKAKKELKRSEDVQLLSRCFNLAAS